MPLDDPLHVEVSANACRLRSPSSRVTRLGPDDPALVHWSRSRGGTRLVVAAAAAMAQAARCLPADFAAAAIDSTIRARPELLPIWRGVLSTLRTHESSRLRDLDGVCESGAETLVWLRLRRLHGRIPIRRQVGIPDVGRVDFLIGSRLIVEVDGHAHHGGREHFERDRRRDASASGRGYRTLRFTALQAELDPGTIDDSVTAALRRGDHRE